MNESFLIVCRQNYFEGVTPSGSLNHKKEGYKKIVQIAKEFFKNGEYTSFADYFQEGQYLVALWAAHMLIEYGNPGKELMIAAFNIIKEYSDNPLAPNVSKEESAWLNANLDKYKQYL